MTKVQTLKGRKLSFQTGETEFLFGEFQFQPSQLLSLKGESPLLLATVCAPIPYSWKLFSELRL
ncbi:MAG: hypothetical protein ABI209_12720 [Edaphobacter sp.]